MEVQVNEQLLRVEKITMDRNHVTVILNGKSFEFDVMKVENGIYSFLHNGKSYEMEIVPGKDRKSFIVGHRCLVYNVEIVDSQSRYMKNRKKGQLEENQNSISSPMPGKVVKIPVEVGEKVEPGQTLIIISAMKMESEYKAKRTGIVKEILTREGETIEGNQSLIRIE
ncbi:MAG: biotin/lipoyl-binding protein [Bacteroidales bacterium]|nr:MAG: biotin/lipoyl-binding protein [Bacteroidales bacterium]